MPASDLRRAQAPSSSQRRRSGEPRSSGDHERGEGAHEGNTGIQRTSETPPRPPTHLYGTTPSPYTVSLSTTSDPNDYTLRQASPNTTPSLQTARVMNQELGRTSSINRTLTGRFVNSGCQYYGPNDEDQYYGDQPQSMSPESDTKCLLGGIVSPVYEKAHGVQTAFQGVAALATASTGHWPGANASLPLAQPPTAQQARSSSPAYYTSPPASTSQLRRPTVARPSRASATSPPQQPANTRQITSRAQPLQVTAYNTASLRSRSSGTATTPPTSGYDQQRPRFYRGAGPS